MREKLLLCLVESLRGEGRIDEGPSGEIDTTLISIIIILYIERSTT